MDICRRTFGVSLLGSLAARALAIQIRPKLLVLVVLEQLRPDYLDAIWNVIGTGGLRRMVEKGTYYPDCRHAASTFSASSMATLATGAWPSQHGIVADSWLTEASKKPEPANEEALLATTLAAQVAARAGGRVFVIGDSAAQAGLFAGTPDARLFWMDAGGRYDTRGDAPDWLAAYNSRTSADMWHNAKWMAAGAAPDAPPLRVLTYDQNHPGDYMALYRSSPYAQSAGLDLLVECIAQEKLGQTDRMDFAVVLSNASAMLGYETGADSPLMRQMVLQLDRRIEGLFADLTKATGENGFTLAVTGAHGAPPEPAPSARARMAVDGESVAQAVAEALAAAKLGGVRRYVYPFLYLDIPADADHDAEHAEAVRLAAGSAAMRHAAVAGYYTAGGACSTTQVEWRRRFQNSFQLERSGDVMLSYRPEYVEDFGQKRGISYGSLYNYDVRVPLCFFGPQFRAGVHEDPVESVDCAPTLARVMGVAAPSSSIGRVLGEGLIE